MNITYYQLTTEKKPRQPKRYHHKVQTGCLVCRRRRIKCDETKPTCVRCQKNFSECTWPVKNAVAKFDEQKYRDAYFYLLQDLDLYQKAQAFSPDSYLPRSINIQQGTWQDRRCLDYYISNIATLLPSITATGPEAQLREVCLSIAPRFAQYSPTVRHALSAEACADESHMRHANTSATLRLQRDRQYQATVQALLKTDLYMEEILLCCVLLYSYACFVRAPDAAWLHVRSGLRMIEEQRRKGKDDGTESRRAVVATIEGALKCLLVSFGSIFPDYTADSAADAGQNSEPFESIEAAHKELRKIIIALAAKKNLQQLDAQLRRWNVRFENPSTPRGGRESDSLTLLHQTTQFTWRLLTSRRNRVVDQSRLHAIQRQLTLLFSQQPVAVMMDAVRLRDVVREMTIDINSIQHGSTPGSA